MDSKKKQFYDWIRGLQAGTEKLSFSSFNAFCDNPLAFYDYKVKDRVRTAAMFEGSVKHAAILEPDKFEEMYAVEPEIKPSSPNQVGYCRSRSEGLNCTDAYFDNYASTKISPADQRKIDAMEAEYGEYIRFCAEIGEREVVSKDLYDQCMRLKDRIYMNDSARWVLDQITEIEKPVEWELGGYQWRGIIDGTGETVRTDLKFLRSADPRKCRRQVVDSRYHWQVGNFYGIPDKAADGSDKDAYIIAVSKEGYCSVIEINAAVIATQWEEIEMRLGAFSRCIFKDEFDKSYDFWRRSGLYKLSEI